MKRNKLIHGMLTPWQIWEDAAAYFSREYCVVIPELDGHTEDVTSRFLSVKNEAAQIKEYLLKNFKGKIHALCGLSMGGRIAAVLAGMEEISVKYLILDGAPLDTVPGFVREIMKKNYLKIIAKSRLRDPKVIENCKRVFLPERYLPYFLKIADHMEMQSVRNIIDSVFALFEYKTYSSDMKILFMHGTKGNEMVSRKAAKNMKKANMQTEIHCFKGYAHAQLACFEINKWIAEVSVFITS
ncbi:MAG: alpha/beta hydrolase [Lachnospiraceae bacterium]|nr:alpha/beta hydrolase [Lachnospiraceae bacterium]